ncbi:hypothetical protein MicroSTF_13995 [Microbacterium sp. STF-2]|uniref:hypothetical protein n=1 Tax=Microbacterium sp. STF-2 TaxID=3031132 RepID=UPI002AFF4B4E|nr:hypothetical protein [Microbacterium sp. STF-2]MEA1264150.1 hypothetical protein [Microbacterium sp. STF-2]
MPIQNARKHKIPGGGEQTVNRKMLFEDFGNSIRDIVPVASINERGQLLTALSNAGEAPTPARPLVVLRADARGLHRIEYTTDGTIWLPASGVLDFQTKALADSFGSSNGGLISVGDTCTAAGVSYYWTGASWDRDTAWAALTLGNSWVNFGAPFRNAAYKRENGWVSLRGSIKAGEVGVTKPIATLPTGFRPIGGDEQYLVPANLGTADLRVATDGSIYIAAIRNGGDNGVVGISQVRFSI